MSFSKCYDLNRLEQKSESSHFSCGCLLNCVFAIFMADKMSKRLEKLFRFPMKTDPCRCLQIAICRYMLEVSCPSHFRGNDFRKDFQKLDVLPALFPTAKILALIATATDKTVREIKSSLCIDSAVVKTTSLDRPNIFLSKQKRKPNSDIYES